MDTIRCKFRCEELKQHNAPVSRRKEDGTYETVRRILYSVILCPVYSDKEGSENKRFWDATPTGRLGFGTVKEASFEIGRDYYIDIAPCAE